MTLVLTNYNEAMKAMVSIDTLSARMHWWTAAWTRVHWNAIVDMVQMSCQASTQTIIHSALHTKTLQTRHHITPNGI